MNFPCLWKTWSQLSKCLHASIDLGLFISFLWLFNLTWNGISDFLTYCILQSRYSNKYITYLLLQETLWYILNFSFLWLLPNVVVAIICWHKRYHVLHEISSSLVTFIFHAHIYLYIYVYVTPCLSKGNFLYPLKPQLPQ